MAHMRYDVWGKVAEKDGFKNVARLFAAISFAETIHAGSHFNELRGVAGAYLVNSMAGFGIGSTSQNLAGAIEGETFEISEMYPTYLQTAIFQGEKGAERSFTYAYEVEKIHASMFTKAKQSVDAGKDMPLGTVHICSVCGYTLEGDAPDQCPLCKAKRERFVAFK